MATVKQLMAVLVDGKVVVLLPVKYIKYQTVGVPFILIR